MFISSVLPSETCEKLLSKSQLKSLGFKAKKDLCGGRLIRRRSSIIVIKKKVNFDHIKGFFVRSSICDLKISDLHISPEAARGSSRRGTQMRNLARTLDWEEQMHAM